MQAIYDKGLYIFSAAELTNISEYPAMVTSLEVEVTTDLGDKAATFSREIPIGKFAIAPGKTIPLPIEYNFQYDADEVMHDTKRGDSMTAGEFLTKKLCKQINENFYDEKIIVKLTVEYTGLSGTISDAFESFIKFRAIKMGDNIEVHHIGME